MPLPRAQPFYVGEDVLRLRLIPDSLGPDGGDIIGRIGVVLKKGFEALYRPGFFMRLGNTARPSRE